MLHGFLRVLMFTQDFFLSLSRPLIFFSQFGINKICNVQVFLLGLCICVSSPTCLYVCVCVDVSGEKNEKENGTNKSC